MWESHDLADAASLGLHFPGRNNEETITAKIKPLYAPANMSRRHGQLRRLAKTNQANLLRMPTRVPFQEFCLNAQVFIPPLGTMSQAFEPYPQGQRTHSV
jgi:hypothetical protein